MLGVSWGIMARPKCNCPCECTCKARMRQGNLQDSLDSLGVEWGLYVRPKGRSRPSSGVPQPQPPEAGEPASKETSLPATAEDEVEAEDLAGVFDEIVIDEETARQLCFTERLEVACSEGGPTASAVLGHVTVAVSASRTPHHVHVRVAGKATMAGDVRCSTAVNGCVDWRSMRTVDERRFERCEDPSQETQEKRLYMSQDEANPSGHYFNIVARQRVGDFEDRRSQDIPYSTVANLASESLVVLLLRYVGLTGYVGRLRLQAVLPTGALAPLLFESTPAKNRTVYGSEVSCISVRQTSVDARGCKVVLRSLVASGTGQLLRHAPIDPEGSCSPMGHSYLVLRIPIGCAPVKDVAQLAHRDPLDRTAGEDLQAQGLLRDHKEGAELRAQLRAAMDAALDAPGADVVESAVEAALDQPGADVVEAAMAAAMDDAGRQVVDAVLDQLSPEAMAAAQLQQAFDAALPPAAAYPGYPPGPYGQPYPPPPPPPPPPYTQQWQDPYRGSPYPPPYPVQQWPYVQAPPPPPYGYPPQPYGQPGADPYAAPYPPYAPQQPYPPPPPPPQPYAAQQPYPPQPYAPQQQPPQAGWPDPYAQQQQQQQQSPPPPPPDPYAQQPVYAQPADTAPDEPEGATAESIPNPQQEAFENPPPSQVGPSSMTDGTLSPEPAIAPNPKSELVPSAESEVAPSPKSVVVPSPKSEVVPSPKSVVTPKSEVAPTAKSAGAPEPKSEVATTAKSEVSPTVKSEVTPTAKSAVAPGPKSEVAPSAKSIDTKSEVTPNAKSLLTPGPKPEVAPTAKSEVTPTAKSAAALGPKTEVAPIPKSEVVPIGKLEVAPSLKTEIAAKVKSEVIPNPKSDVIPNRESGVAPSLQQQSATHGQVKDADAVIPIKKTGEGDTGKDT